MSLDVRGEMFTVIIIIIIIINIYIYIYIYYDVPPSEVHLIVRN